MHPSEAPGNPSCPPPKNFLRSCLLRRLDRLNFEGQPFYFFHADVRAHRNRLTVRGGGAPEFSMNENHSEISGRTDRFFHFAQLAEKLFLACREFPGARFENEAR